MKAIFVAVCLGLSVLLSACQSMMPHAQGLSRMDWAERQYQRQDQVEVNWKDKSFSFLLYQQQQGKQLELLALSFTGQQLFKLKFDGTQLIREQYLSQMKHLPFEFVVRDILFATDPSYLGSASSPVRIVQQTDRQQVYIGADRVLEIQQMSDHVQLNNFQVPYQMQFSPIQNNVYEDQ